jgi:peptidoglycan/LPS O-acetylase OafA/YrhL
MERTTWLDGLRGIAAAIVAFDHYFMSDVWHPFVSFWTEPPEYNRHIVQLPPIRILFSAHGMVTLFMVISGYAISISLLNARDGPQFLQRMSSAIVRRVFRIYLPVIITASIAQIFYFFDLYHWEFDQGLIDDLPKPWSNPWAHFTWLMHYMAESINVIASEYRGGLNGQLWTMPLEFRGSNVVYLLIIGLSGWRRRVRLIVLPTLGAFFFWWGNWDIFGFIWGLWLAEKAHGTASRENFDQDTELEMAEFDDTPNPLFSLPERFNICSGKRRYKALGWRHPRSWLVLSRVGIALVFLAGYYLLCLGNDGHLPTGYGFLSYIQSSQWKDRWHIYHFCWKELGSAMLVFGIAEFKILQRPLDTRVVQYLGKISFALYLLHETIYQLLRNPLRDFIYSSLSGGMAYETSAQAWSANPFSFHIAWWVSGILLGSLAVLCAHCYTKYVDDRCVAFAKRIDRWLSV